MSTGQWKKQVCRKTHLTMPWKGYQRLVEKKLVAVPRYLTICDFSQSSKSKRLFIIDVINQELIVNTFVAHGKNSGGEYATKFSNNPESLQSSLGFFVTKNTYIGAHGLSLRLAGSRWKIQQQSI